MELQGSFIKNNFICGFTSDLEKYIGHLNTTGYTFSVRNSFAGKNMNYFFKDGKFYVKVNYKILKLFR